jgi:hypothetical protein
MHNWIAMRALNSVTRVNKHLSGLHFFRKLWLALQWTRHMIFLRGC